MEKKKYVIKTINGVPKLISHTYNEDSKLLTHTEIWSNGNRKLYRHESGMGTVIECYIHNKFCKFVVLDAVYRAQIGNNKIDGGSSTWFDLISTSSLIPRYYLEGESNTRVNISYTITNKVNVSTSLAQYFTDEMIDNAFNNYYRNGIIIDSAKEVCDNFIKLAHQNFLYDNVPQSLFAMRALSNEYSIDIPTITQLYRIYCDAEILDQYDPTVSLNPNYKLSDWNINKISTSGKPALSCTSVYYTTSEFTESCLGSVLQNGSLGKINNAMTVMCIPIIELIMEK